MPKSKFAKNVTVRRRLNGDQITYVQEYFGLLERYYVRMYIQEFRDEFFEALPGAAAM